MVSMKSGTTILCLLLPLISCTIEQYEPKKIETENNSSGEVCLSEYPLYSYKTLSQCSVSEHEAANVTGSISPLTAPPKPICDADTGCNPRLNCSNFLLGKVSSLTHVFNQSRVVGINASQLQLILDSYRYTNTCVVVMFYARWCPFSVEFSPIYNALGRSFPELPFLALDFGGENSDTIILAYLPRVLMYYGGRVVYSFDTTMSQTDLADLFMNFTDAKFVHHEVNFTDTESPLPSTREQNRSVLFLYLGWIMFIVLVSLLRCSPVKRCLLNTSARLQSLVQATSQR